MASVLLDPEDDSFVFSANQSYLVCSNLSIPAKTRVAEIHASLYPGRTGF
jgi:hypothetical protein